jgi:ribokinase
MSKIIVVGSINMDVVTLTTHHPRPGETVFGSDVKFIPGGKGSNQAVAASRLTDGVTLVGKLGKDAFGTALHQFLQTENLNLDHLSFSETAPTGTAIIAVDENSENTIIVVSGSNFEVSTTDAESVQIEAGDIVVSVFEVPQETIKAIFQKAKSAGATTVLNPAPAALFIDGLHELCDYLIVNETELAFFAGTDTVSEDMDIIRKQAQSVQTREGQTIIVTLGAKGVVCLQGDDFYTVPGHKVNAMDTTGAGDCFTGALSVALMEGRDLKDAIAFANIAASLSVQKIGASDSLPYREQVDSILNS